VPGTHHELTDGYLHPDTCSELDANGTLDYSMEGGDLCRITLSFY
jgi:hypothetical protein